MKTEFSIQEMKRAWREMCQERTCPEYAILVNPKFAKEVEAHKKRCAHCAALTEETIRPWKDLGKALLPFADKPKRPEPEAGQIWSLKKNLGHWDDLHRHINPPIVLLVEILEDVRGVRVAQTFLAPPLVFDGDIEIDENTGHAQAWNTYAMRLDDLEYCWGKVSDNVLTELLKQNEHVEALKEPDEHSVIHFFRELELEIGSYMAMQALPVLMHRLEYPGLPDWMADLGEARKNIQASQPKTKFKDTDNPLIMLGTMELPDELIKKAASEDTRNISYNVIRWGEDSQTSCRTGLAVLDGIEFSDSTIHVEGWLDKQDRQGRFLAWWNLGDEYIEGALERDPESGYFEIDFVECSREEQNKGKLILFMVENQADPNSQNESQE